MYGFRFFNLTVYKEAKEFKLILLPLINSLKESREYGLYDQLSRASSSVILNIAEGSLRRSKKEQYRYMEIALGSLNESVACIDIIKEVQYITLKEQKDLTLKASKLAKMLMMLMKYSINKL